MQQHLRCCLFSLPTMQHDGPTIFPWSLWARPATSGRNLITDVYIHSLSIKHMWFLAWRASLSLHHHSIWYSTRRPVAVAPDPYVLIIITRHTQCSICFFPFSDSDNSGKPSMETCRRTCWAHAWFGCSESLRCQPTFQDWASYVIIAAKQNPLDISKLNDVLQF